MLGEPSLVRPLCQHCQRLGDVPDPEDMPEAGGHASTEPSGPLPHGRAMGCPHLQRLAEGAGQGALRGSDWATCPSGIPPRAIALPHLPLELLPMDSHSLKPS